MPRQRIHVECLLGRMVRDIDNRRAGRIEEIHCEDRGRRTVVTSFLLGQRGLMQRLSISGVSLTLLSLMGASTADAHARARWDQLDLADPDHPRLRCRANELEPIEPRK